MGILAELFTSRAYAIDRIQMGNYPLEICWSRAAHQALKRRQLPLIIEMQLYFSCNIKKLVYFHQQFDHPTVPVSDQVSVYFRAVRATSCDPIEFARNYPTDMTFESEAAQRMHARSLDIDYRDGKWQGSFDIARKKPQEV